jgi:hypothetical protein
VLFAVKTRASTDVTAHSLRQAEDEASRALWKQTHELFVQALLNPTDTKQSKALLKLKGKDSNKLLPPEVETELFSYDGFLTGLGRISLSQFHFALGGHVAAVLKTL